MIHKSRGNMETKVLQMNNITEQRREKQEELKRLTTKFFYFQ